MTEELRQLWGLLGGSEGHIGQVLAWLSAVGIPLKLVSGFLQDKMTEALARVCESPDNDDDAWAQQILQNRWYRMLAFQLDLWARFKIPTLKTYLELSATARNQK